MGNFEMNFYVKNMNEKVTMVGCHMMGAYHG
jgi:hypothetical protein